MSALDACPTAARAIRPTTSDALAEWLHALGVRHVFGVSGGGIAYLWGALSRHPGLRLVHCQHESGAAFAATEASLACDEPVAVFTTTGPGLTNGITGLMAARSEGARVLVFSGVTPGARRHRLATQEVHAGGPLPDLFVPGALFDLAAVAEGPAGLAALLQQVALGMQRPGGCVAHIGLPTDLQARRDVRLPAPTVRALPMAPAAETLDGLAARLADAAVTLLVGFEARHAAAATQRLARRLGAPVVATPRAKGIVPEDDPACAGVLGLGGHPSAVAAIERAEIVLCLGAELGEGTSQYAPAFDRGAAIIQIHPRSEVLGGALPAAPLEVLAAAVGPVVEGLLRRLDGPDRPLRRPAVPGAPRPGPTPAPGRVTPQAVLAAVQRLIDARDVRLLAEAGNAFVWSINRLRLREPRLRVSVRWGSMGHATSGAIGAAIDGRPVLALVGDGAMLMTHEVATAVMQRLPVVWLVLNDSRLNMCHQGSDAMGIDGVDCRLPSVDFAAVARGLGARGLSVGSAEALDAALAEALDGAGPSVLDVRLDPRPMAPIGGRIQALAWHADDASPDLHPAPDQVNP